MTIFPEHQQGQPDSLQLSSRLRPHRLFTRVRRITGFHHSASHSGFRKAASQAQNPAGVKSPQRIRSPVSLRASRQRRRSGSLKVDRRFMRPELLAPKAQAVRRSSQAIFYGRSLRVRTPSPQPSGSGPQVPQSRSPVVRHFRLCTKGAKSAAP